MIGKIKSVSLPSNPNNRRVLKNKGGVQAISKIK